MTYVIAEPCIGTKDTACVAVCPVDCIHPTKDDVDFVMEEMLYIDPDTCIDCGLCVDECPVKAIFPEASVPAEWHAYIQLNADKSIALKVSGHITEKQDAKEGPACKKP